MMLFYCLILGAFPAVCIASSVLCAWKNFRTAEQIFMKFDIREFKIYPAVLILFQIGQK